MTNASSGAASHGSIVVIDDDDDNLAFVEILLPCAGYETVCFDDGRAAMALAYLTAAIDGLDDQVRRFDGEGWTIQ
jgi:CheY-like chemotaxis protein